MEKFGVIFDCDGTLIKSLDLGMGSYDYALRMIGEAPRRPEDIKQYFGAAADRIFYKLLGDEKKALEAFHHYFDHESKQVHKIELHQGIAALLEELRKHEIPMGVVTGRHSKDLDLIFSYHKLHDYFEALICDNQLPFSKPEPHGILLACEKMGLKPSNTWYVGDSVMDMIAANRAGSRPVAALWDHWVKESELAKERPEILAKSPAMILDHLNVITKIHD